MTRLKTLALAAVACGALGFFSPAATAQDGPAVTYYLDTATGVVSPKDAEQDAEIATLKARVTSLERSLKAATAVDAKATPCLCGPLCPKGGCTDCDCQLVSAKPAVAKTRTVRVCENGVCRLAEVADDAPLAGVPTAPQIVAGPTAGACSSGSCSTGRSGRTGWYPGKLLGR
jgi:hypothetical protein